MHALSARDRMLPGDKESVKLKKDIIFLNQTHTLADHTLISRNHKGIERLVGMK